jgi:hypothetical protein
MWFDDPTRLTTAAGLISAGLAFALQRVVTAVSAISSFCAAVFSASVIAK